MNHDTCTTCRHNLDEYPIICQAILDTLTANKLDTLLATAIQVRVCEAAGCVFTD